MAIQVPQPFTQLNIPHWQADNSEGIRALLQGAGALGEGLAAPSIRKQEQQAKLEQLLKQGQISKEAYAAKLAEDAKALEKLKEASPEGAQVKAGELSAGVDPALKFAQQQQSQQLSAAKSMNSTYNRGASKMSDQMGAIGEGIDALQNPTQITRGFIKTNLLKALGMNRFNEAEANALLPPTLAGAASRLLAGVGADTDPIPANQAAALSRVYKSLASTVDQKHAQLVEDLKSQYPSQLGPAPALGDVRTKAFKDTLSRFASPQLTPEQQLKSDAPLPVAPPATGVVDKLASFFGRKPAVIPPPTMSPEPKSFGQPAATPKLAPEDAAAIDWAKSNPNDPRATDILKLHGVQ